MLQQMEGMRLTSRGQRNNRDASSRRHVEIIPGQQYKWNTANKLTISQFLTHKADFPASLLGAFFSMLSRNSRAVLGTRGFHKWMFVDFESEHYVCMCARVCGRMHSVCACAGVSLHHCRRCSDKCLLLMTDRCESDTVLPAQADTSCFFTLDQGSLQCEFDTCRCSAPLSSEKFTKKKQKTSVLILHVAVITSWIPYVWYQFDWFQETHN